MSGGVSDGDEGLEPGALTGGGLLLNGHDLHDLILELVLEEVVDDLGFLHRDGEEEDLLDASDLSLLDEATELGDGNPDVLVAASTASSASSATASAASTTTASSTSAESSSSSFSCWCVVAHLGSVAVYSKLR